VAIEEIVADHTDVLNRHSELLHQHTDAFDSLSHASKALLEQKEVTEHRLERLEHWGEDVGEKVCIELRL
jgi:L-ascorbate metabolism protein UlaG (beta-lactamase superfamily)